MANQVPMVNGRKHSWASIECVIGGRIIEGITAIKYGYKQTKTNNYGRGKKVTDRTYGNEEPEASITLYLYEVKAILNGLGAGKKLTDAAPFNIAISYVSPDGDIVNDKIKSAEFLEKMIDVKQNDPKIEITLPLIVGDVEDN